MAHVVESGRGREPYWRLIVARWKRSGLSARAFCRAEGVNEPMFYWWRKELIRRDQLKPKPAFLPVRVLDDKPQSPMGNVEIVLANGRCVRVGVGFDPHTLVRVVELLEDGGQSC
jgi:transposase